MAKGKHMAARKSAKTTAGKRQRKRPSATKAKTTTRKRKPKSAEADGTLLDNKPKRTRKASKAKPKATTKKKAPAKKKASTKKKRVTRAEKMKVWEHPTDIDAAARLVFDFLKETGDEKYPMGPNGYGYVWATDAKYDFFGEPAVPGRWYEGDLFHVTKAGRGVHKEKIGRIKMMRGKPSADTPDVTMMDGKTYGGPAGFTWVDPRGKKWGDVYAMLDHLTYVASNEKATWSELAIQYVPSEWAEEHAKPKRRTKKTEESKTTPKKKTPAKKTASKAKAKTTKKTTTKKAAPRRKKKTAPKTAAKRAPAKGGTKTRTRKATRKK